MLWNEMNSYYKDANSLSTSLYLKRYSEVSAAFFQELDKSIIKFM